MEETLNHKKSLKLKSCPGENVTCCFAAILVDAERLESAGAFKPEHLGYINRIFEDTHDPRFRLLAIQKYKEVTDFIKKLPVCDIYAISQEYIITYASFVPEATREYSGLIYSKQLEPATSKEKSQDQTSFLKASTVAIEQ